ncbi:MAG TPA: glycosyltransferase [Thermoanaerobaculia bacterium]|nr:glycosyltransferase [Thermoanaerobaculia bacterium]
MKILHVIPTYLPAWRHGGPIFAVHGLARALAARGHEVTVFTTDVHGTGKLDVPLATPVDLDGVRVYYFGVTFPERLYRSPAMGAALEKLVPEVDLVHLHSVFLWPTAAAARAAEKSGVPYLLAPRGMLVEDLLQKRGRWRKRLWIDLVERRTLRAAAGLHVTSEIEAEEVKRLSLPLPPIHLVPNGVEAPLKPGNEDALAPAVRGALERRPLLLFLGRVNWKKGLDRLIPALAALPEATLAIAGNDEEGYQAHLLKLARQHGVEARVLFLGSVHGADKAALLYGATVLVLPSYSENFGNSVLEAMAVGTPVAVTPEVGLAGVIAESGAGIVTPGDPESLGAALRQLLADPAQLERRGRQGARAAQRFSWPTVAARMEAVYAALARSRAKAAGG